MPRAAAIVLGAGAALAAGLLAARRLTHGRRLNRLLNGNLRLFRVPADRNAVAALASGGRRYVLQGWPRPGVGDAHKRRLVTQAAAGDAAAEATRLALLQAPAAARRPHELQEHGDVRVDDFYWLRDDERKDPDVVRHLEAENAYTRAALADTEALQAALYLEMRGRIQEADRSAPLRSHGFYYYTRTEEGAQYAVHCRRALPAGAPPPTEADVMDESAGAPPEEVLLDENAEAAAHAFYMVGGFSVSPDDRRLAYGVDTKGNEMFTLHVKDLATGLPLLARPIPDTAGGVAWAADNTTLFYVTKDALDRPHKVWRHVIGSDPSDDALVYHEEDEAFYVGVGTSRSERLLQIHSGSAVTSDVRVLAADDPAGEWRLVLPRVPETEYSVDDRGEQLFITVRDAARPNSELLVAPLADPAAAAVLLPHREDVKLEGVEVGAHFLVAFERQRGLQQAVVYPLPAGAAPPGALQGGAPIAFDEPAYELSAGSQGDFDSPVLRMHYTSLTTPDTVIDYDMSTGRRATKKVQPVLGGFDAARFRTERLWATAPDGVQVPVSLVYRPDLARLDGSDPLLLNAYGSYEIPNDADFRSTRLSLLDRGFVFAIAHVRGGGEMGRRWYEDGKFLLKRNTFTDFVACAELLVERGFTSPGRLCIEGRSAGGLTMGAVCNMRPDLFAAAILGVPFVDALTTMLDDSIPLTTIETEEWGDPKEEQFYRYMKTYSPVDNLRAAPYPHMLVTAGLHDPRVGYWEPAKLVAKLRTLKTDANMLLLKCEMGAGHFSQSGRFDRLKEVAVEHAFLLKCVGMLEAPLTPSGQA